MIRLRTMTRTRKSLPLFLGTAVFLSACGSLTPTPYTKDEIKDRVVTDRAKMFTDQEPVTGPIDLPRGGWRERSNTTSTTASS
jgi:hypothetical protein